MAGSFKHIIDKDLKFRGTDLLDNLGDCYEALEECYDMIMHLTEGNKQRIYTAWLDGYVKKRFPETLKKDPKIFTYKRYWEKEEEK